MYITVDEALALPAVSDAVLLSGENGLNRRITSVNIMEVPGISRYVKPEELIITTMYPIRDNEELQKTLIPDLVKKGVSALFIVPLSVEQEIPSFMIEQAAEHAFPLIKLPADTSFNEILNPILGQILERKHIETEHRFRARIIDDLLRGKITSRAKMLSLGKYYGWNLSSGFIPAVIQTDEAQYHESSILLLQNLSKMSEKNGISDTIAADLDDGILLLFPYEKTPEAAIQIVRKVLIQFSNALGDSWIGIGRAISDIMYLSDGFNQARQAAEIAQKIPALGGIVDFERLGVYRVLFDRPETTQSLTNKQSFVKEKLGSLIEHDKLNNTELLHTLQVLFEQNGNLRQAAKQLYIHHNTMRYRLDQIENLTNADLNEPETKLEFQIAIKLAAVL